MASAPLGVESEFSFVRKTLGNVRYWHKADIAQLSSNVRFWG